MPPRNRDSRSLNLTVVAVVLWLATCNGIVYSQTSCRCARKHTAQSREQSNVDLEIAKIYVGLKNWPEAESHYVLAAKDPSSRREALAGLANVRSKFNAEKLVGETAPLAAAKSYDDRDIHPKSEDLYRNTATNSAITDETRKSALAGLEKALDSQKRDRMFTAVKEWTERIKSGLEFLFWLIALILGCILAGTAGRAIWKRRQIILFQEFKASSEDASRALSIILKHARARMQNPALAPGRTPGFLLLKMPTFSDELEPIEDLELGGSKIPFAAIAKELGKPKVQINGGFDASQPTGEIFAVIDGRGAKDQIYLNQAVRTQVPNQQQGDLFDFAYDVIVKASGAYANV